MRTKSSGQIFVCPICHKEFVPTPCQKWRQKKYGGSTYCSVPCYNESKQGEGNPKWRGGTTITDGYIYVYQPNHPYATKKGYVCEHRLVIEGILGRYLTPEESVHHINGDTLDNTPENLKLENNEPEHRKLHARYRTRDAKGRFEGHVLAERMI